MRYDNADGLVNRAKSRFPPIGPSATPLPPKQLTALDQFQTRGIAPTADLARLVALTDAISGLDIGSGVGGPMRRFAETCGCHATGIDQSEAIRRGGALFDRSNRAKRQGVHFKWRTP